MAYRISQPLAETQFDDDKKKKQEKRKSNRAIDAADKKKRKAEIHRQYNESKSGLARNKTYSVDVSGERKVKKKVVKIQQKMDKISDKKDARQKKAVEEGRRVETRKNKLLQKQVEAKRVELGKDKDPAGKPNRTPKDKPPKTKKQKAFKGKPSKNAIKPKRRSGSQQSSCKSSMKSKSRKPCKLNV
mgnify:CR=1 FL=1